LNVSLPVTVHFSLFTFHFLSFSLSMDSRYRWNGLWQYALLGAVGLVLFGGLYQRYGFARRFNLTLDHAAAIARAQTIAQELGWPVNDWEVRAWTTSESNDMLYYGWQNPDPAFVQIMPPVRFNVHFRSLTSPQTIQVRMAGNGQLIRFTGPQASADETERRGAPPPPLPPGGATPTPTPKAEQALPTNTQLAEQIERRYFPAVEFTGAPTVTSTRNGFDFTWKKDFPTEQRFTLESTVEIASHRLFRKRSPNAKTLKRKALRISASSSSSYWPASRWRWSFSTASAATKQSNVQPCGCSWVRCYFFSPSTR
jgi:hypothetical protein